jgi:hypothetical protein
LDRRHWTQFGGCNANQGEPAAAAEVRGALSQEFNTEDEDDHSDVIGKAGPREEFEFVSDDDDLGQPPQHQQQQQQQQQLVQPSPAPARPKVGKTTGTRPLTIRTGR